MNRFVEGKEVITNGVYGRIKKGCRNMEIVHGDTISVFISKPENHRDSINLINIVPNKALRDVLS